MPVKNAKHDQSEFSKKSTCELCATLRNRGNAFNQAKFSFLKKRIENLKRRQKLKDVHLHTAATAL